MSRRPQRLLGMAAVGLRLLYSDVASLAASRRCPPTAGRLAGSVLILATLIVVETTRYAQTRRSLRGASSPASRYTNTSISSRPEMK